MSNVCALLIRTFILIRLDLKLKKLFGFVVVVGVCNDVPIMCHLFLMKRNAQLQLQEEPIIRQKYLLQNHLKSYPTLSLFEKNLPPCENDLYFIINMSNMSMIKDSLIQRWIRSPLSVGFEVCVYYGFVTRWAETRPGGRAPIPVSPSSLRVSGYKAQQYVMML